MSEAMDVQASDLTALNNLYTLNSVLQGMLLNIQLIESGTIGKTIAVTNANLFQIAAVEYGDATQWTVIAKANGLSDPMIEATLTATYMAYPPATTIIINGIPQSPQTIIVNVDSRDYSYHVTTTDTLNTIAANIARLIPNVTSLNNSIIFPQSLTVSSNVVIQRVVNLVIPQQSGIPSGGIL